MRSLSRRRPFAGLLLACLFAALATVAATGAGADGHDRRVFREARGGAFGFRLVDISDLLSSDRYLKCSSCDEDRDVAVCRPPHAMTAYADIVVVHETADLVMVFVDAAGTEVKRAGLRSVAAGVYGLEIRSSQSGDTSVTGWRLLHRECVLKEKPRTWLRF